MTMTSHIQPRLKDAMDILDNSGIIASQWDFGGGSALELMLQHRKSEDIDLFVSNPQIPTMMSPRLNDYVRDCEYDESSSHLKLYKNGYQIDFICTSKLMAVDSMPFAFNDTTIFIEHPTEILFKKLFYRGSTLKFRDVFDIVAALDKGIVNKDDIHGFIHNMGNKRDAFFMRMNRLNSVPGDQILASVDKLNVYPEYHDLAINAIDSLSSLVYHTPDETCQFGV